MKKLSNPKWMKVIEHFIWSKSSKKTDLARATGIEYQTINNWFKNAEFLKALEKRFLEVQTEDYILCIKAMVEEAKAGNVAAFKEIKDVFAKIEPKAPGMQSPFTQYVQINNMGKESIEDIVESVEVLPNPMLESKNKVHKEVHESPKVHMTRKEEKVRVEAVKKTFKKNYVNKEKRNALMRLKRRAKKVGLASLGSGRPSKIEREEWMQELLALEKKAGIKHPSL
tara:strand:- start:499 stop:1176 length:678 start_codon:yes stop_codon:yes gene_type:complete